MGRSHALTGWCAGLLVGPVFGLDTAVEVVPFAAVSAGYALLPDLDHPGATVSRFLGPVTGLLSRVLRWCSRGLYAATKGPRDENCDGTHRHMTHTVAFAAAAGVAAAAVSGWGGVWAVAGVLLFGLLLAARALGDAVLVVTAGAAGLTAVIGGLGDALAASAGWVGVAVTLGCLVHCLGDAVTVSGCPFLWPVPIAGETWYELRPPRVLRFRTGKRVERLLVVPTLLVLAVVLVPGVWPRLVDTFARLYPQVS